MFFQMAVQAVPKQLKDVPVSLQSSLLAVVAKVDAAEEGVMFEGPETSPSVLPLQVPLPRRLPEFSGGVLEQSLPEGGIGFQ